MVPWPAFFANKFHPLFVEVGQNCSPVFLQGPRQHATNCLFQTHKSIHPQNTAGSLAGVLVGSGNGYRHSSSRSPSNNNTIDGTQRRQQIS
jgi:hypothetical protein